MWHGEVRLGIGRTRYGNVTTDQSRRPASQGMRMGHIFETSPETSEIVRDFQSRRSRI